MRTPLCPNSPLVSSYSLKAAFSSVLHSELNGVVVGHTVFNELLGCLRYRQKTCMLFLLLFYGCFLRTSPTSSQDRSCEIVEDVDANKVRKMKRRICLVLDCLCAHDFSDKTADLINLQHYVIKEKRLSEREAIVIFYDVVRVVEALHKVSLNIELVFLVNMIKSLCCTITCLIVYTI